ncbi:MAG: hypothetical protein HC846_10485 [Blastocatellia bacterium]|nr:hypothetical protein [Blastocatellia bacterium]
MNFCLSDGAVLNTVNQDNTSEPTIFMGQPPPTNQNPTVVQTNPTFVQPNPTVIQSNQSLPQNSRGLSQTVPTRPPVKKSKAWIWILGILGVFVIVGGVGFIALVALFASIEEPQPNNINVKTSPTPAVTFDSILKDDFSKWRVDSNSFGNTEYSNGEYIMSSKQAGFYYVLVTAGKNFKTSNASTKITVRNVTGKEARLGYGLLIHSDPNVALSRDYAFLIDASKQSYRVVQHTSSKETTLVNWTRFPAIRSGTQTNEIEVRDQNGKMSFFINGQFAIDVTDSANFKDGVFGLYVSDAVPIAFSNLQLAK